MLKIYKILKNNNISAWEAVARGRVHTDMQLNSRTLQYLFKHYFSILNDLAQNKELTCV